MIFSSTCSGVQEGKSPRFYAETRGCSQMGLGAVLCHQHQVGPLSGDAVECVLDVFVLRDGEGAAESQMCLESKGEVSI